MSPRDPQMSQTPASQHPTRLDHRDSNPRNRLWPLV